MKPEPVEGLTEWQAFVAMARFLEAHWLRVGKPAEIGDILSGIGDARPGKTADPATWGDWMEAVRAAKARPEGLGPFD